MDKLSPQEAHDQFLALCSKAATMDEFPWRKLLSLGYQAGFDRNVIVYENLRGKKRSLTFYAETIIRTVIDSGKGSPTITTWNNTVSINSAVFSKLSIAHSCDWLPMFKEYAISKRP